MPRRDTVIFSVIYFLSCALYLLWSMAITYPGFPLDDSWIHQVFARNIVTGHGFSFNPDIPVAGATAPLWTLILAFFWRIAGPVAGGISAGIIFGWFALFGLYKFTGLLTRRRFTAMLTVILAILTWPLIWGSLSGMEVGLYCALVFWGLYFYFKSNNIGDRYAYIAYFLLTASFLARPETATFLGAIIIHDIFRARGAGVKTVLPWLIRLLIIALPIIPYLIFNYTSAGSIFPSTYAAKIQHKGLISSIIGGDFKRIVKALTVFPAYYFQDYYHKILTINPIAIVAVIAGFLRLISFRGEYRSKIVMLFIAVMLYIPLMGTFVPLFTATFQNYRTAADVLPLLIMFGVTGLIPDNTVDFARYRKFVIAFSIVFVAGGLLMMGLFRVVEHKIAPMLISEPSRLNSIDYSELDDFVDDTGTGYIILGITISLSLLFFSKRFQDFQANSRGKLIMPVVAIIAGLVTFVPKGRYYADNVRNVNECDVDAGKYLGQIAKTGDSVAANDVGAIGYYSGMGIFDLKGLISPAITPELINNDSLAFEYMMNHRRVNYLAIAPNWFKYIPTRTDIFKPIREFITENNTILAGDMTRIYVAEWPDSIPRNDSGNL